ncbi:MAG: DUF721 domain-containing protein [Flavobacteriaceae bacterium]|nr:DUF721 domain-containing protein [Flavobacteriaceae bacterium]
MEEAPIKHALDEFVRTFRLREKMDSYDIKESWAAIMGRVIDKHTLKIYIRKRTLYIHVDSSALRNELEFGISKIIALVNEHAHRTIVEDVMLL